MAKGAYHNLKHLCHVLPEKKKWYSCNTSTTVCNLVLVQWSVSPPSHVHSLTDTTRFKTSLLDLKHQNREETTKAGDSFVTLKETPPAMKSCIIIKFHYPAEQRWILPVYLRNWACLCPWSGCLQEAGADFLHTSTRLQSRCLPLPLFLHMIEMLECLFYHKWRFSCSSCFKWVSPGGWRRV